MAARWISAAYRADAEAFCAELTHAYYRHYAGLESEFAIEPVYDAHAGTFDRAAVDALRELRDSATPGSEDARRLRMLLSFAVEGHLGAATRELEAELARTEAGLRVEVDGSATGFRESAIAQANEPDAEKRERIEAARLAATSASLEPLAGEMLERHQALAADLGWASYRAMCEDLSGIDLGGLAEQTAAFTAATDPLYADVVDGPLRSTTGRGLSDARRSDLPRFFRCAEHDAQFPPGRLVEAFEATLGGLGIDPAGQPNVHA